ncbi:MAG: helix-turn-helix transcriptional regulator [Lachnospiraceae bacterium]|nr:helix-turn-helix transcriptional regulator [Lachnospiraceae bacterium]
MRTGSSLFTTSSSKFSFVILYSIIFTSLKELEADGFVVRKQYDEMPVRVEYSLSKKAKSLIPILLELKKWGEENL